MQQGHVSHHITKRKVQTRTNLCGNIRILLSPFIMITRRIQHKRHVGNPEEYAKHCDYSDNTRISFQ